MIKNKNILKLFLILNKRQKIYLIKLIAYSIIAGLLDLLSIGLIIPYLGIVTGDSIKFTKVTQRLSEFTTNNEMSLSFGVVTTIFFTIIVISVIARIGILRYSTKITFRIGAELARDLIQKWILIDYQEKKEADSAEVVALLNTKINDIILNVIFPTVTLASATIFSITISIYLFYLFPDLSIIVVLTVLVSYAVLAMVQKNKIAALSKVVANSQHRATKILIDILMANKEIIINKKYDSFAGRFSEESQSYRNAQGYIMFAAYSPRYIIEGIGIILMMAITNMLILEKSPVEVFAVIGTIALGAQKLLPNLQQAYSAITLINGSDKTVVDFLKIWKEVPVLNFNGQSSFLEYRRNFGLSISSFAFKNTEVLRNSNLVVSRGTSVALIGPSGAGKSTAIDLLLGFLYSEGVRITVDDIVITSEYLESWRNLISYIPQSMYVYDADVISNITCYGPNSIDLAKLDLALELTGIKDNFNFCLSTYAVGDNGAKLSGGQKQRIGLARAIYSEKPIMILDEATNALDTWTERNILSQITLLKGRTLFVVTHRLEILDLFDKIAFINSDKSIVSGSFGELLACNAEFANFVASTKNQSNIDYKG